MEVRTLSQSFRCIPILFPLWLRISPSSSRSPAIRCFTAVCWLRPTLRVPALPLRPVRQLFRLEGDVYRREQRHGNLPAEAGIQGGYLGRGRDRARAQDNEQDDGQHDARQREAYVSCLFFFPSCPIAADVENVWGDTDADVWLGHGQWSSRRSPSMLTRSPRRRSTSRPRSTRCCRSTGWGRRMRIRRCRRHDHDRNQGSSLTL